MPPPARPKRSPHSAGALRPLLSLVLVAVAAGGCSRTPAPGGARPPDVVLISIDTLRADRLGTYGYRRHATSPAIDALGADGIVHLTHMAASPWTVPSHMSLLTSLHPSSHGVVESLDRLKESGGSVGALGGSRVTLAEALSAAGYRTAAFTGGVTLAPELGFDQGFETYRTSMYKLHDGPMREMLDWLAAEPDRPAFLFWHTFEVHAPYLATEFLDPSLSALKTDLDSVAPELSRDPGDVGAGLLAGLLGRGDAEAAHMTAVGALPGLLERHGAWRAEVCSDLYDGGIASVDRRVAELVDSLRRRGRYDETLIVLTSDHGEEFTERDPQAFYDVHGRTVFEEMIHVPLIVKLPRSERAGTRVEEVTRAIDVMPTVLETVGVEGPRRQMQGLGLRALWDGEAPPRVAFAEASVGREFKAIRDARHKAVFEVRLDAVFEHGRTFVPDGPLPRSLYDLERDPGERVDLLALPDVDPRSTALADAMEAEMRRLAGAPAGDVEEVEIDEELRDRLRGLGYIQ